MHILLPLTALLSLATASALLPHPLQKRWQCSSAAPGQFSCYPPDSCKSVDAWAACATKEGLEACGDALPSETQPPSACQSAAFTACETANC